jgi:hypothetical protein
MLEIAAPLEITVPRLQRLHRDWEERRRGREFPSRADFNPLDLRYILGNLSLLDVTYNPLQFHYRIHASLLAERIGKEMTNKSVDDIPVANHAKRARDHFTEVVQRRIPLVYARDPEFIDDHMPKDCEVLVRDGTIIDMLISALVWDVE